MIEFLTDEFAGGPKPILIPTSDQEVEFVSTHADTLSRQFRFQNSYATGLAQALVTKASLYEICAEHGVVLPRWLLVTRDTIEMIIDHPVHHVLEKFTVFRFGSEKEGFFMYWIHGRLR